MKKGIWVLILFVLFQKMVTIYAQTPEMVIQSGHSEQLWCVALSNDNKYIVTGGWDNSAKLWDLQTGKQLRSFQGHEGYVMSVSLSQDGKQLATGSNDKTAKLWDIETGKILKTFQVNSLLDVVQLAGDDKILLTVVSENINGVGVAKAILWDVASAKQKLSVDISVAYGIKACISKNGKYMATFDPTIDNFRRKKCPISIRDVKTGQVLSTFGSDYENLRNIAISGDGKFVVVQQDSLILLWDAQTGTRLKSFNAYTEWMQYITISDDGQYIASACNKGKLIEWEINSGKEIQFVKNKIVNANSVIIGNDNKYIVSGHGVYNSHGCNEYQNMAILWDAKTGKPIRTFTGIASGIMAVALNTDGRFLASACSDTTIRLWDTRLGKQTQIFRGHTKPILSVAINTNGRYIVSSSQDNTAKLWDTHTGIEIWSVNGAFSEERSEINVVDVSGDGRFILTGDERPIMDSKGVATLWDTKLKIKKATFEANCQVCGVSLSEDGKFAAASGWNMDGGIVTVWDVNTGNEVLSIPVVSDLVKTVSLSNDGKLVSYSQIRRNKSTVSIWNVQEKAMIKSYAGESEIQMTEDGNYIVAGGMSGTAFLLESNSGKPIKTFNELRGANKVNPITISGNGKLVALIGDGYVKYWNREVDKDICTFVPLINREWATITPDFYYFTSRGAYKGISFVQGYNFYSFDNFDLFKNRPDVVLQQIGNSDKTLIEAYKNAYLKRLKRLGLKESDRDIDAQLPVVEIISHDIPLETISKSLSIKIRCSDKKNKLDRINVYINDVAIYGFSGISLKNKKSKLVEDELQFELSAGINMVQVSVLNQKGLESLRKSFQINYTGTSPKPNLYVLAIGVSKYADSKYNLTYAAKDANDLANMLKLRKSNFGSIYCTTILDENATRENILKAKQYLLKAGVEDEIIVSVAGHGLLDSELDYYIATTDVDFINPSIRGLAYSDLESLLDSIPARKKVLFIDACNSGEVDKEESLLADVTAPLNQGKVKSRGFKSVTNNQGIGLQNSFELMQELFSEVRKGSGAFVISSASGTEFSLESDLWKNGVFTFAILEGVKTGKADLNNDGKIKVSELRDYVTSQVISLTGGKQTPTSRKENLDNDFIVF